MTTPPPKFTTPDQLEADIAKAAAAGRPWSPWMIDVLRQHVNYKPEQPAPKLKVVK